VRNNLEGLIRTAASIQTQTDAINIEHVVIDGDSTDGTKEWLANYSANYEIKTLSEPDDGIYQAMNKGLKLAQGSVVQFLNGGDILAYPRAVQDVLESLERGNWQWAYGGICYVDSEGLRSRTYHPRTYSLQKLLRASAFVPHPATFANTKLVKEGGGFKPQFGFSADQEMAVRLTLQGGQPAVLDHVLVDYLEAGAHGASTFRATAERYQSIRRAHGMLVCRSAVVDTVYTSAQANFWAARHAGGRAKRRVSSVFAPAKLTRDSRRSA
jgi:glycosyltransferase